MNKPFCRVIRTMPIDTPVKKHVFGVMRLWYSGWFRAQGKGGRMKKYTYHADGETIGGRIEQAGFGIIANIQGDHDDMRRLVDQANAAVGLLTALKAICDNGGYASNEMLFFARDVIRKAKVKA